MSCSESQNCWMNHPDFFSFLLTGNLQFFHALLASLALLLSRLWVESLQAREAAWQGPTVKRERTLHLSFGKHWRYRLALMSPPCSPSTLASASGSYNKFVYTHTHIHLHVYTRSHIPVFRCMFISERDSTMYSIHFPLICFLRPQIWLFATPENEYPFWLLKSQEE